MPILRRLILAAAVLFIASPASAVPVTYGWTAGTITVQATQTSDNALVFDETLNLSSDSFLEWDAAGVPGFGTGTLDDFLLRVVPGQGPFSTLLAYGPYDQITIVSADITPDFGAGYSTIFSFGGSIQVGDIAIDALYDASASGGFPPPSGPTPANILPDPTMSATLNFGAGDITLSAFGIAMGTVDGTPFGEAGNDLELTANITFFGDSNTVPTPEPSTALLMGLGLTGLAVSSKRQRR